MTRKNFASQTSDGVSEYYNNKSIDIKASDARPISEYILAKFGYSYDRNTKISYVRTALSVAVPDMHEDCIGDQNNKVDIPKSVYSDDSFIIQVSRIAKDRHGSQAGLNTLNLNGKIDNQVDQIRK